MSYVIFIRNWYRRNPAWPNGLEPCAGRRYKIATAKTADEARGICRVWNANHKPGRLSKKAEYKETTQ